MSSRSDDQEMVSIATAVLRRLRNMDESSSTGLCGYVECTPLAGKRRKEETAITWGVTEALRERWSIEQREHYYPSSRRRCDRKLELASGGSVWLEVKLAWRTWYYDGLQRNAPFIYRGYFHGEHHSHSVAHDFRKLERIGSEHGDTFLSS